MLSPQSRRTLEFRSPALRNNAPAQPAAAPRKSGFYVSVDEFAGIDQLDRAELDDDDADVR